MGEYLNIQVDDKVNHNIFANKQIAFYPQDGFMIFEGYAYPKKSDLPITAKIFQIHSQFKIGKYYEININNIFWKDLQSDPTQLPRECTCEPSDDLCECFISFFPSEIIIIEFSIIDEKTFYKNPIVQEALIWNYCIDSRFNSPSQLLINYKQLLDLPDNRYDQYDECIADKDFYAGYYSILNMSKNKYDMYDEDKILQLKILIQAESDANREKRNIQLNSHHILLNNNIPSEQLIGINKIGSSIKKYNEHIQNLTNNNEENI
jgi:hypothetical protein